MLQSRKARPEDLSGIMEVVHQAQAFMATLGIDQWQDGYPPAALIAEDIRLNRAYVCEDEGHIASIAIFFLGREPIYDALDGEWHTNEPYLTIHRMAIDDAHRHSGLAQIILAEAKRVAKTQQQCGIRVDTHRGNIAMRRFLDKNGFTVCGLVRYPDCKGDPFRIAYDLPILS